MAIEQKPNGRPGGTQMTASEDLRALLQTLDPKARADLRHVLIATMPTAMRSPRS
jgi:hypothetical protein